MSVNAIVAMARNRVIGRDNALPWRLPEDLKRFKRLTMGHVLLMGRKTYESIGRPLPGRTTWVLTRQPTWSAQGVERVNDLAAALERAGTEARTVFVAGGEEIYRLALPYVTRLYLTHVEKDVDGDARFPELDLAGWALTEDAAHRDEGLSAAYRFQTWERR
ncbi:MAG TPA: dihydrofolate reductase [Myxococcaceae bacterium]|nr:dihydrofolate reductase [Myxococcaceae bacterium]